MLVASHKGDLTQNWHCFNQHLTLFKQHQNINKGTTIEDILPFPHKLLKFCIHSFSCHMLLMHVHPSYCHAKTIDNYINTLNMYIIFSASYLQFRSPRQRDYGMPPITKANFKPFYLALNQKKLMHVFISLQIMIF